ncbi:hypothetical protein [Peribacillus glennii]|uniref:hypothetical protein n=1 Tax=Peribacillus glennii TaxID=2303991 RepID=UPI001314488A|nr:hypothetical protein [Peribacillus glennii]
MFTKSSAKPRYDRAIEADLKIENLFRRNDDITAQKKEELLIYSSSVSSSSVWPSNRCGKLFLNISSVICSIKLIGAPPVVSYIYPIVLILIMKLLLIKNSQRPCIKILGNLVEEPMEKVEAS